MQCLSFEDLQRRAEEVKTRFDKILDSALTEIKRQLNNRDVASLKAGVKGALRGKQKCLVKYFKTLNKGSPPLMMSIPPNGVSSVASSGGSKLWSCCFCCCFCFIYFTMYLYGGAKRPSVIT